MRWMYGIACLLLYPLVVVAQETTLPKLFFDIPSQQKQNVVIKLFNSDDLYLTSAHSFERSIDSPTHIIRMTEKIDNQQVSCEQVNKEIEDKFINKITKDKFIFSTILICEYDPITQMAVAFSIQSYFDPLNDDGVLYLRNYMNEYNGSEILGSPLTIEEAKAVIVSLSFRAGWKKNPAIPPFIEYKRDKSNHYFKSNFDLKNNLITDIELSFYSDEPGKIMPLLDKWLFPKASIAYKSTLLDSNYTVIEPEKIFLMNDGEPLFVSPIKQYYQHHCSQYEHGRCLKPNF